MINVTKTFFPPLTEYNKQLQRIWDNEWLTNRGELVRELEGKLKSHLSSENPPVLTANGTLPMQIALKNLAKNGEVITTPFSYVATTSSIVWENCTPVFVDIHPEYLTIDETKIEAAITDETTCILATHVFGNPCAVEEIDKIAKRHDLKVIYDAAHGFGTQYKGHSIFDYGDVSTCSFHATKLFHTGEGGAFFCKDPYLSRKLFLSHNFGHDGPGNFRGAGINAKMSELQAAMGLSVLPHMDTIYKNRKRVIERYEEKLNLKNSRSLKVRQGTDWNFSYYPVVLTSENQVLTLINAMQKEDIHPRRYFYPSLNTLPYVNSAVMEVSEDICSRILCLPLAHDLTVEQQELIISIFNDHSA